MLVCSLLYNYILVFFDALEHDPTMKNIPFFSVQDAKAVGVFFLNVSQKKVKKNYATQTVFNLSPLAAYVLTC